MRDQNVPFTEKDVTADEAVMQEMLKLTGGAPGTPVLHVGSQVLRGWDRDRLSAALGL